MIKIPLDKIRPNPNQPRQYFDGLEELAQSLREEGQLTPILVRPDGGGYELVNGERRWRAAKLAGLKTLRAEVRELTDEDAFRLSLVENVARANLTPIEEAEAFRKLTDNGMTQAEVGELVGKSQQYVADRLALLKLPGRIQELVTARAVNPSVARRLVTIDDPKVQTRLARRAAEDDLTVKEIEYEKQKWEREKQRRAMQRMSFAEMVQIAPELAQYATAVKREEIEVNTWIGRLEVKTLTKEFTGQTWHWPKYSGCEMLILPGQTVPTEKRGLTLDKWAEDLSIPLFSEQEWDEWQSFDEQVAWQVLDFPGKGWFREPEPNWPKYSGWGRPFFPKNSVLSRRTYDHDYGRFIADNGGQTLCGTCPPRLLFVKRGWGKWCVVEFNDGMGGRTRRRFFEHDHIGATLIDQAKDTVDPFAFSEHNFKRLKLWQAQRVEVSWFYARRETIPPSEMIAALEEDLERLRDTEPLSDEEFMERVLTWLQEYRPPNGDYGYREGVCSYARRPDGAVDAERMEELGWT